MRAIPGLVPLLLLLGAGALPAAELTGAATPLGEAFCAASGEAQAPILRCPGPAGVDAFIHREGGVSSISLGDPIEGFVSIGQENRLGATMEWRSADGRPFAGIVRFRLAGEAGGDSLGDVFAILKTAENGRAGCLVALVDGSVNPQGRDLARRIADERAASFACGTDTATFAGVSSDWARALVLDRR